MVSLKHQLNLPFKRKGIEESCRKWINRTSDSEIQFLLIFMMESFKDETETFFQPDTADTHLGIMPSMNWFQPFENSQYSTGQFMPSFAICLRPLYALICILVLLDGIYLECR